eukprot:TRINITY_DN1028_c0_g1_i2.p1 TRINITY_DN1028_c0_g1~~TRINITY_DN1028_c0_g1_i2.p1  ORF type:complete len:314 (-),score=89.04 TRINITY_DN1028_c0_g1_i2:61-1002(-)
MGILLSTPVTTKESECGKCDHIAFGASAMQGWRTSMEDAQSSHCDLVEGVSFFAVFDGHGGDEVSRFCSVHMHEYLKNCEAFKMGDYKQALIDAYIEMDKMMATEEGIKELSTRVKNGEPVYSGYAVRPDGVGCTAVSCIYHSKTKTLYVANAGDSRIVLCHGGVAVPLSIDHKPNVESESSRILKAGGYITNGRVNGNLNLCRAIGDQDYKKDATLPPKDQIITAYPDVKEVKITDEDEFVVLGCDGVWDVLSNQQCVDFVREIASANPDAPLSVICENVLDRCCAKETSDIVGCDNISFTLVKFLRDQKQN